MQLQKPSKKKVEKAVGQLLTSLGFAYLDDPNMADTPKRVAKMFVDEIFAGCYSEPPILTSFPNDRKYDQLVISNKISFHSVCSHHLLPFYGFACVGVLPNENGELPGYSKYARCVEWFARRPQLQENLTEEIADHLENGVRPSGVGVYIKARHLCACARGVHQTEGKMITIAVRGKIRESPSLKAEFLDVANS